MEKLHLIKLVVLLLTMAMLQGCIMSSGFGHFHGGGHGNGHHKANHGHDRD